MTYSRVHERDSKNYTRFLLAKRRMGQLSLPIDTYFLPKTQLNTFHNIIFLFCYKQL